MIKKALNKIGFAMLGVAVTLPIIGTHIAKAAEDAMITEIAASSTTFINDNVPAVARMLFSGWSKGFLISLVLAGLGLVAGLIVVAIKGKRKNRR